jgi:hypothetical protein
LANHQSRGDIATAVLKSRSYVRRSEPWVFLKDLLDRVTIFREAFDTCHRHACARNDPRIVPNILRSNDVPNFAGIALLKALYVFSRRIDHDLKWQSDQLLARCE